MEHETIHSEPPDRLADPAVFAAIYQQYALELYRFFYHHTGSAHDAEDLTATTFSRALVSLERYEEQGRFAAWLFAIARHTLRDAQRRQRPQFNVDLLAPVLVDPDPLPEALIIADEQAHDLRQRLGQLPPDQRAALVLRFFGDMSISEIANVLGRSIGSVKMLVHRGLNRLRDQYREATEATASLLCALDLVMACLVGQASRPALQPVRCRASLPHELAAWQATQRRLRQRGW